MVAAEQIVNTAAIRADVKQWLQSRPDVDSTDLAQYTGVSPTAVRMFLSEGNDSQSTAAQLRRVVEEAKAGNILAPSQGSTFVIPEDTTRRMRRVAKTGNFYATQTVRKIHEVLDYCCTHAAIGVITADFGVGKSESVRNWIRKHDSEIDTCYIELDDFSAGSRGEIVRLLAEGLGLAVSNTDYSITGATTFRAICDHLRQHPALLIVDQCEMARPRICQILRQIWDRTHEAGTGVCMLAAPILLARLFRARMGDLGALTSRVGVWAPLSGLTRNEMAAIVKQEGLTEIDDAAFDLWFKSINGSMRHLMRSLDLLKARHAGKRITEKTIEGVAAMLWGMSPREGA